MKGPITSNDLSSFTTFIGLFKLYNFFENRYVVIILKGILNYSKKPNEGNRQWSKFSWGLPIKK